MNDQLELDSPAIFIGKQGGGIISFGSGQPDLPPPKEAIINVDLLKDMRYGLIQGQANLREALAKEYTNASADDFVITNGASEALDLVFRALGGGKVLVPRPYYYSYPYIISYAGLEIVYTDLVDGKMCLEDFNAKVKDCCAVLINSPSNPTGRVEDVDTLKQIEAITKELGIYVISDEVYKSLIYERENYEIQGDHVITINSFSKTYAMCGLRVGYLWSSNKDILRKIIDIKTHSSMNTNLIGQDIALRAMQAPKEYTQTQKMIWGERRDVIYKGFCDLGFDLWRPEGAFYIFPKCKNAREFVTTLYQDYKVIVYLGAWFGDPDRIRLSYALNVDDINEGLNRIESAMKKIKVL